MKGTLDREYAVKRENRRDHRYRLKRRTFEVAASIARFFPQPRSILDLGTAEGKMLHALKKKHPAALCVGVDFSWELLSYRSQEFSELALLCADVQNLAFFRDESFDVVIATAVIEHLSSPQDMVQECRRLLSLQGILIITTPHPFWDKISGIMKMTSGEHQESWNIAAVVELCRGAGLRTLDARGFMLSPIGLPGERGIEKVLSWIKLNRFLPNQLVVARKD